jgi:hypothetical protein
MSRRERDRNPHLPPGSQLTEKQRQEVTWCCASCGYEVSLGMDHGPYGIVDERVFRSWRDHRR